MNSLSKTIREKVLEIREAKAFSVTDSPRTQKLLSLEQDAVKLVVALDYLNGLKMYLNQGDDISTITSKDAKKFVDEYDSKLKEICALTDEKIPIADNRIHKEAFAFMDKNIFVEKYVKAKRN